MRLVLLLLHRGGVVHQSMRCLGGWLLCLCCHQIGLRVQHTVDVAPNTRTANGSSTTTAQTTEATTNNRTSTNRRVSMAAAVLTLSVHCCPSTPSKSTGKATQSRVCVGQWIVQPSRLESSQWGQTAAARSIHRAQLFKTVRGLQQWTRYRTRLEIRIRLERAPSAVLLVVWVDAPVEGGIVEEWQIASNTNIVLGWKRSKSKWMTGQELHELLSACFEVEM